MTPGERERAINALDESRERLLATVRRLSPSQLAYKPAADRWSVAECVEHIILVENSILGCDPEDRTAARRFAADRSSRTMRSWRRLSTAANA